MNPQQPNQPVSYNSANPGGAKNSIVLIFLVLLLVAALIFGGWAYAKMLDYKNNTDKKIDKAVAAKSQQLQAQAQNAFDAVNTYEYKGLSTYGSVSFRYPKTWSAYIDTTNQSEPINGYFMPGIVPGINSKTAYALRVELVQTDYSQLMQQFQSYIQQGMMTAKAYVPPKLNGAANVQPGTLLSGQVNLADASQKGTMLVIKVRDKTLEISTQSTDYLNDFNGIILPSLTFNP